MKALLFLILVVLCICFGSQQGNELKSLEMDQLLLSNVEALANDEGGGMLDCPNGCLDKTGHCFCYGYHPYEEKAWK